jgi:phosphoserine phosphatase RsbU/P
MRANTSPTLGEVLSDVQRRFAAPASSPPVLDDCGPADHTGCPQPRIMIVDDESLVIDMLKQYLSGEGYGNVIATDDPVEAYALIRSEQPDLLLLDHYMSPINGLSILAELRAELDLARLPVIVLTADTDAAIKLKALELGASDFLNKPINSAEFLVRVRNILNAKAHEDQLHRIEREKRAAVERELMAADAVQTRLYPAAPPIAGPLDIAGASYSAGVGCGDYFDFLELTDGNVALVVGDVSGHGMPAALRMVEARACLHCLAKHETDAGRMLTALNQYMIREAAYGSEGGEQFVTLFLAVIDRAGRELVYASAGHAGYVIRDEKPPLKLMSTGLPLGVVDRPVENSDPIPLRPGDVVLVATDGIEETAHPSGRLFGAIRLLANVQSNRSRPAEEIVSELYSSVREFSAGLPQQDDVTVIVARVNGELPQA